MATKFARSDGEYDNKVYDSGDKCKDYLMDSPGQDTKKFSDPARSVPDYSGVGGKQKLKQKINTPTDSGEGMGSMKAEGGSTTRDMNPKSPRPKGNKASAPKRGDM